MIFQRGYVLDSENTVDKQVISEAGELAQGRGRSGGVACEAGGKAGRAPFRNPRNIFKTQEATDCDKCHKNETRTKNLFRGFHSNKIKADFGEDSTASQQRQCSLC